MSPVAVTEGLFGGKKASPPRGNREAPRAVAASAVSSPTASAPPAKKRLTATQQQEADRRSLQEKLSQVDDLMFKATQKSVALATMEESMIRLQRSVAVERDGRVVAETMAEQERLARERAEEKIQKEIEERHDLIARLDRANDVARHAENETRDVRLGMKYRDVEVDRSAQEKILEADLATGQARARGGDGEARRGALGASPKRAHGGGAPASRRGLGAHARRAAHQGGGADGPGRARARGEHGAHEGERG
jgi:hypothetical protein